MAEENTGQEFRLKNIDKTRIYLSEDINPNELKSKKHENITRTLNYINNFFF